MRGAWRKVAVKFYGYRGMNILMKDFGSSGKKKRKIDMEVGLGRD